MHAAAAIQAALTEQRRRDLVRLGWSPLAADFMIAVWNARRRRRAIRAAMTGDR